MTKAQKGDQVVLDYTVRTNDGRVVGGTEQAGPQKFTLGEGKIFPQIETSIEGLGKGEEVSVTVPTDDAFGPRREDLVVSIPRAQLPDGEPQPGMQLSAQGQDGQTINLTITEVGEESVSADGNHPLAGEDLHFALTLVDVEKAA